MDVKVLHIKKKNQTSKDYILTKINEKRDKHETVSRGGRRIILKRGLKIPKREILEQQRHKKHLGSSGGHIRPENF